MSIGIKIIEYPTGEEVAEEDLMDNGKDHIIQECNEMIKRLQTN